VIDGNFIDGFYVGREPVYDKDGNYVRHEPMYDKIEERLMKAYSRTDVAATQQLFEALYGRKETVKVTDNYDVDDKVAAIRRERAMEKAVADKLGLIADFGPNGWGDGTVLRFRKGFTGSDTMYTYAAIVISDKFYTTGPRGSVYTYDEFVNWLVSGDKPTTRNDIHELFG